MTCGAGFQSSGEATRLMFKIMNKQTPGPGCSKLINANPRLKVNQQIKVFISLTENFLKANLKLMVKKSLSQN